MAEPTSDIEVLLRLVEVDGRDVVDVGCGQGLFTGALDRHGARAIGVEVTEARVRNARHCTDGSGAIFVVGRGEALPLPAASQDVVVYLRSLHHVPIAAMGDALREARRVLRDGGTLHVVEPLPEGDLFAMVRVVDDETEVRAAAQAELSAAAEIGLTRVGDERYELSGLFGDLDDVRRHLVGVDPARAPAFDGNRDRLQLLFDAGGERVAEFAKEFRSPQKAEVFRAG